MLTYVTSYIALDVNFYRAVVMFKHVRVEAVTRSDILRGARFYGCCCTCTRHMYFRELLNFRADWVTGKHLQTSV